MIVISEVEGKGVEERGRGLNLEGIDLIGW